MNNLYTLLGKTPLFNNIDAAQLDSILKCMDGRIREYGKNHTIFMVGSEITHIGIIICGTVKIIKNDYDGTQTIITELVEGEIFGETFAFSINKLPISVITSKDSTILFLNCKKIITACSYACPYHSTLIENMLRIIATKNIFLNQKIDLLSKRTIREKLLTYFASLAQNQGSNKILVPFNREEMADFLCADRSSMSRELSRLKGEGIIDYRKNQFKLLENQT